MEQAVAARYSNLLLRVLTTAVLIPAVIAAVYYGSPIYDIVLGVVVVGALYEWHNIFTAQKSWLRTMAFLVPYVMLSRSVVMDEHFAELAVILCLIFTLVPVYLKSVQKLSFKDDLIFGVGGSYIVFAAYFAVLIREQPGGLLRILSILMIVWASDIGAFFFGKLIGGPKLAPKISPNKTIAGFVGGTICGIIMAAVMFGMFTHYSTVEQYGIAMILGGSISIVGHLGDLLESKIKRLYGIKDSSSLFPGHGGLLDRTDSLFAAFILVGLILLWQQQFAL